LEEKWGTEAQVTGKRGREILLQRSVREGRGGGGETGKELRGRGEGKARGEGVKTGACWRAKEADFRARLGSNDAAGWEDGRGRKPVSGGKGGRRGHTTKTLNGGNWFTKKVRSGEEKR